MKNIGKKVHSYWWTFLAVFLLIILAVILIVLGRLTGAAAIIGWLLVAVVVGLLIYSFVLQIIFIIYGFQHEELKVSAILMVLFLVPFIGGLLSFVGIIMFSATAPAHERRLQEEASKKSSTIETE